MSFRRFLNFENLRAALVISFFLPQPTFAQFAYPTSKLFSAGDDIGARMLRQTMDCYGQKKILVSQTAASVFITDFNYLATPAYNCAAQTIQPNLTFWQIATSSSTINAFLRNDPALLVPFPTDTGSSDVPFPRLHFALSAKPITDFSTFQTARFGNAIQFPLFGVPIAIAYDPVYAKSRTASGVLEYKFNINTPFRRADGSGGLRLNKTAYCAIFNPLDPQPLRNWNDPRLRTLNANISLQDPAEAALGIAFSVPIRLVGRGDASPATAIFTRHLAAACGAPAANIYANATEQLPSQAISGADFTPAMTPPIDGAEVPGRYLLASGSSNLAQAIDFHPTPTTISARSLNGKIGYAEPDQVLPGVKATNANTYLIATANLQQKTTWVAPTAANITTALATIMPPQSTATGVYAPATSENGNRGRAADWVQPSDKSAQLAFPTAGYPIVGTSNALFYTCYGDAAVRKAMSQFISLFLGQVKNDSIGAALPPTLLTNPTRGLLAANGFGGLPTAWQTAITETFFTNSVQPGTFTETPPLRFVTTGSRSAYYSPNMLRDQRMFRQRTPHQLTGSVSEFQISLMNWLANGGQEIGIDNAVTYKAVWIERGTTGEIKPVTFNGQRMITLPAKDTATHHPSDLILASSWSTPPRPGETFWVHMVGQVPDLAGQQIPNGGPSASTGAGHKRYAFAADAGLGIDYVGPVPSIPGYNAAYTTGVPILFLGRLTGNTSRAIGVVGDSITQGFGDAGRLDVVAGTGYAARASFDEQGGAPLAVAIFARTGESATDFLGSNRRRLELLAFADVAHVAYGTNDIGTGSGANPLTVANRLRNIRSLIRNARPNIQSITAMTLLGHTDSTDQFSSLARQTPVSTDWALGGARDGINTLLFADRNLPSSNPARINALFDMAAVVMAPSDRSRWQADGNPRTWVQDGLHPATLGHDKMAEVARTGWLGIPLAPLASPTTTTLGARNLWIQDGLPASATSANLANPGCLSVPGAGS